MRTAFERDASSVPYVSYARSYCGSVRPQASVLQVPLHADHSLLVVIVEVRARRVDLDRLEPMRRDFDEVVTIEPRAVIEVRRDAELHGRQLTSLTGRWVGRSEDRRLHGRSKGTFVTYRVEARVPDEFVLLADGSEVWRGTKDPRGSSLRDAVILVAAGRFVADSTDM